MCTLARVPSRRSAHYPRIRRSPRAPRDGSGPNVHIGCGTVAACRGLSRGVGPYTSCYVGSAAGGAVERGSERDTGAGAGRGRDPSRDQGRNRVAAAAPLVLALACAAGFAALLAAVARRDGAPLFLDVAAFQVVAALRCGWLTWVMRAVSLAGTLPGVLVLAVLLGRLPGCRGLARWGAAGAVCVRLLNAGLKALVARPRPDAALWLVEVTETSFPSGHAMNAVALLGLAAWWVWRSGGAAAPGKLGEKGAGSVTGRSVSGNEPLPPGARRAVVVLCALAAALVCASRVYLGVHYLSDVLAGACAAGVWLAAYTRLAARWGRVGAPRGVGQR